MTMPPKIPMSPHELPHQRLHAVVSLPERPTPFDSHFLTGEDEGAPKLPKAPRSPELIVHCEWAWSPMHSRLAAWYLHRSKSHWILWIRQYDDNWGEWAWDAVARVPHKQASEEQAATHLLMDAWRRERDEMSLDRFHWISEASLLSISQIKEIGREVWG